MTTLAFTLASAAANVLGAAALFSRRRWSRTSLELLLGVAAGFMIAVALLQMLPAAYAGGGATAAAVVLAGFVLVHLTQHVLAAHFHFGEERHVVQASVRASALVGLGLHTLVDGVAIVSGFAVSDSLGLLVFLAIFLHKFPEGLAIGSVFLASGASRAKALGAAGALGAFTVAGGVLATVAAPLQSHGIALSAGVTLYVAASNLVPELQKQRRWTLAAAFLAGCALYLLASSLTASLALTPSH